MIVVKPSDLKFKYPRDIPRRFESKFSGIPDPTPFNRDDLYEVLPMFGHVMKELGSDDGRVLHLLEDLLNEAPRFVATREEMFRYLVGSAEEWLRP